MKSWRKGDPFTTTRRPMQILSPSRVARTTKDYKGTFAHWTWTSKLININSYLSICLSVLNQVFWAKICIGCQVVVNESPFLQLSLLFLNVWWMNVLFETLYKTFFFFFCSYALDLCLATLGTRLRGLATFSSSITCMSALLDAGTSRCDSETARLWMGKSCGK